MGYPRIAATLVVEGGQAATTATIAALRQGEGGARPDRSHRPVGEQDRLDQPSGARVALDLGMKSRAEMESLRAIVLARCNRPEVVSAVVEWHDCGEDEPEPVHLPYEHPEYQAWRLSRDCSRREYGRFEKVEGAGSPGSPDGVGRG